MNQNTRYKLNVTRTTFSAEPNRRTVNVSFTTYQVNK
jgi:hypothetical protein